MTLLTMSFVKKSTKKAVKSQDEGVTSLPRDCFPFALTIRRPSRPTISPSSASPTSSTSQSSSLTYTEEALRDLVDCAAKVSKAWRKERAG